MKKYLLLLLAIAFVVLQKAHGQTPVAYYPFTGNANDAIGTNNGTVNGATLTTDRFGAANSAYSFDGVDDFIDIGSINFAGNDYSISFWVQLNSITTDNTIFSGANPSALTNTFILSELNNGVGRFLHRNPSGTTGGVDLSGVQSFPLNNWKFVSCIKQGTTLSYYVNGVLDNSVTNGGVTNIGSAIYVELGRLRNGANSFIRHLNGKLDEVKIYNTALTAAQVQNEYLSANNYSSQFGNSVKMNGTSDYIDAGTNTAAAVSGALTVEAWIKPASLPLVGEIVQKGGTSGSQIDNDGYQLRINNSGTPNIGFVIANSSSLDGVGFIFSASEINTWMHVVGVYDGTTIKIYKNGILQNSKTTSQILACNSNPLLIGKRQDGFNYDGYMDEVRIWNTARTQTQIVANMNNQLTGNEAGLVAYYDMNRNGQGAGLTVDNKCVATGSALNGTTVGTASTPIFAPAVTQQKPGSGNAISFDGVDDIIDIPNNSSFNFSVNQNFTVECWAKIPSTPQPNEAGGANSLIEKWDGLTGEYPFVIRYRNNASFNPPSIQNKIEVARWNGTTYVPFYSNTNVNDDKFHHISFSKNGALLSLYIDGILHNTATDVTGGQTDNPDPLHIGGRTTAQPLPFNGTIDEVRIWNTALTQAQIRDRMCRKITNGDALYSNLVAYYNFDETTGTIAFDGTANGNNGTLTNNPTRVTSGAAIGNASVHDYVNSTKTASLAHASGESFTVTSTSGNPDGIHIYRVDELPNVTTGIMGLGNNDRYFGVFQVNGTAPQYTAEYNYNGNPGVSPANENDLALFKRTDNSGTTWTNGAATLNTTANTLTLTGQSTEYILGSTGVVLPLNLIFFTGSKQNNDVHLQWNTANEVNVSHFEIEKSIDGRNFASIGTKPAFNQSVNNYSFTDNTNGADTKVYYRIRLVDANGRATYSSILWISFDEKGISIYPTVFENNFNLQNNQSKILQLDLYSADGKWLQTQAIRPGTNTIAVNTTQKGIIIYRIQQNGILVQSGKLWKQ